MIVGVTGCPGSGKSTLAAVMRDEGWTLIDADRVGREVVESDGIILAALADAFGSDILGAEGQLDRRMLAGRAFADKASTARLNAIVHPALIERLKRDVYEAKKTIANTVIDCALIFEWGIEDVFDIVVCVRSGETLRTERLLMRDGRSEEEIADMFAAQIPEGEKAAKAKIVITNEGSIAQLTAFGKMLACVRQ